VHIALTAWKEEAMLRETSDFSFISTKA